MYINPQEKPFKTCHLFYRRKKKHVLIRHYSADQGSAKCLSGLPKTLRHTLIIRSLHTHQNAKKL